MANRHIFIGAVSIIFTIAVVLYFSRAIFDDSSNYEEDINFNQIGHLVYNNPGMKKDTWYLIYEQPGASALSKELQFDSASACAINTPAAPCDLSKLEAGTRVRLEGRTVGEAVLVRTIQLPEVIQPEIPEVATPTTPGTTTGTSTGTTTDTSTGTTTGTTTATATGTTTTKNPPETGLTVKLYYYNQALDQGPGGAQCSRAGLVPIERTIPRTNTPLQDTIKLLLRGELTDAERNQGITSEFPLSRVTLLSASNNNGVLTLTFRDPKGRTSGGSCRVNIMWSQIETTAKQFPGVNTVRFMPETLFQP